MSVLLSRKQADVAPAAGAASPADRAQAFHELYVAHFPFVWRCLKSLGVPDGGLDDAAQDVFLAVHRQLPTFRGDSAMRTWLFGILRHVASNHRRAAERKSRPLEPLADDLPSAGPGPLDRVEDARAAAFVRDFVSRLDARRRELFVMVLLEELSIPEASAALGMRLNTAYTQVRRMRAALQEALARREETT